MLASVAGASLSRVSVLPLPLVHMFSHSLACSLSRHWGEGEEEDGGRGQTKNGNKDKGVEDYMLQ